MSYEKLKNSLKISKKLLESDTLGSFDFYTSTVCLDSVDSKTFKAFQFNDETAIKKILPLVIHEYTHFVDSTSTLWGMKHLQKMNEAYCSNNVHGGTEHEFFKAKNFFEYVRSLRLPKYYTVVNQTNSTRPWHYNITTGIQFGLDGKLSEKPILFTNFINKNGEIISRSPISIVSILEASAMSNEIAMNMTLIEKFSSATKGFEIKMLENESLDYIYNQHLTEYSVCVHMLANSIGCKDILVAFRICSMICRIILNLPDVLFENIIKKANIDEILSIPSGHEFGKRILNGVRHGNLGIVYYLICRALPENIHEDGKQIIDGLELALNKIGLSFEIINHEALKEIEIIFNSLDESPFKAIRLLGKIGMDNFNKIGLDKAFIDFSELSLPAVFLGDGNEATIFNNESNLFKGISTDEIFNELYSGEEWVNRFSEACTE